MTINRDRILSEWLLLSAQCGDRAALDQLVKLWRPKLIRFAERQLHCSAPAEDAVQQTLIVLSKDLHKVKDVAAFPRWLYQILQRRITDEIRRRQRDRQQQQDIVEELDVQASGLDERIDMTKLLNKLPVDHYLVVHLFYLEGLNLKEIARTLAIPLGTVKSRLHNAKQNLKIEVQ